MHVDISENPSASPQPLLDSVQISRRLEAAPEVEAVAIMIAEKSRGHLEDMENGEYGCELQHRLATDVPLLH